MGKQKLLSVVIPTYNMEDLLPRCLDSLLVDDKDLSQYLEVIIVNDGSKDSSLKIALKYQQKHPDIFVVIDKENGNYGSCINAALSKASGLYFRILDADDYFDTLALKDLLEYIQNESTNTDIIVTNFQKDITRGRNQVIRVENVNYKTCYDISKFNFKQYSRGMAFVMHSLTYKLKVLKEVPLVHLEKISYTDTEYCFYPLYKCQTISFLDIVLYHYQIGRDGQTVSVSSYQKNISNLRTILNRMLDTWIANPPEKHIYINQKNSFLLCAFVYYQTILTTKFSCNEDIDLIESRIASFDQELYTSMLSFKRSRLVPFVYIWRHLHVKSNNFMFRFIYHCIDQVKKII